MSKKGKASRSNTKSKKTVIDLDITRQKEDDFFFEKICEIKNTKIPLIVKSEKLLVLDDLFKIKENEKQINIKLQNKTKENNEHELNNIAYSQSVNNESTSIKKSSNTNSKNQGNADLRNLSAKNDNLRRFSLNNNKDSILNTNGESLSKNNDFGTPNEVFENNDLSQKNLNNLRNFNKYLPLNDIITEEDSNFNNNYFTNLETNNVNENKNYKNNLTFEDLPEENENINEDDEERENANELYDNEENTKAFNNLKYNFIKNAIFQHLKNQQARNLDYNNRINENRDDREGPLAINLLEINNIFYENIENSDLGYMQKEVILKNVGYNRGNIFYALLLESQKANIELYQSDLFGEIFFDN